MMNKSNTEFVQVTNPDGSISLIEKKKQTRLIDFIKKLEKIPPVVKKDSKEVITLGLFNGIEFKMYPIKGRYWGLRITLEKIYPNIKMQFSNLCREYVEEFDCYWLEEGIDYIYLNWKELSEIDRVKNFLALTENPVLLSVEGLVKLLSRSSKMKVCLFWLIKKFMENGLLKVRIKEFEQIIVEARRYLMESEESLEDISKLLDKILSYENELLGDKAFNWITRYALDHSGEKEFHPIKTIRLTNIWQEGKNNLINLNRVSNKGKLICHYCKKEILKGEPTTLEHLHYKKGFENIFSFDYAVIIHKKCDTGKKEPYKEIESKMKDFF